MNKLVLVLLFACTILTSRAQVLLDKVPDNASLVLKYAGQNFATKLPMSKLESYSFVREHLFKALKYDSSSSLDKTGLNLEDDMYQYMISEDSVTSFVSLFKLKDPALFLKMLDQNHSADLVPASKNGYQWVSISSETYVGWNQQHAIICMSNYNNPNRYSYYYDAEDSTVVDAPMYDTTMIIEEAPVEVENPVEVEKPKAKPAPKKKSSTKSAKGKKSSKAPAKKKSKPEPKVEEVEEKIEEVTIEKAHDEDVSVIEESWVSPYDSAREARMEERRKEMEKATTERQKATALNVIERHFNGNTASIKNDVSYGKVTDPQADVSVWVDYDDILQQYWLTAFKGRSPFGNSSSPTKAKTRNMEAFKSGANIFFEKDKMRVEQKSYSPDENMAKLGKQLFDSKQSKSLAGFVNPGYIAYLSMSINSEAMANYYYSLIKQYMSSTPYFGEYADIVDVYVDFLEIIIDEQGIADLLPGNCMFVLHDMKTVQVSYTDYVYDDDFKSTPVQKTRQELSPNFTIVLETRKQDFMNKLAALPLKYAEKAKFTYLDRGGYYELVFDTGKSALSNMYFMVKDGKCVITTSKETINMATNNTGYALDDDSKRSIMKNNYSFKLDTKRLLQQISPELNAGTNRKISEYVMENVGDMRMESSYKKGMIKSTTTMAIKGNHTNSLEFFFNMIEGVNNIIKAEDEEREKKYD